MKTLQLTQGMVAIIDDSDYEAVSQFSWRVQRNKNTFYAMRHVYANGKRTSQYLHRYLLNPSNGIEVDHEDGNGLNNVRLNLRLATDTQQSHNQRRRPSIKVNRYKGVSRTHGRYQARIQVGKQRIGLGCFPTDVAAAQAYDRAALIHFGEYASLNFEGTQSK
jgi:hypothetical protein